MLPLGGPLSLVVQIIVPVGWNTQDTCVGMAFSPWFLDLLPSKLPFLWQPVLFPATCPPCHGNPTNRKLEAVLPKTLNPSRLLPSCHRDDKIQEEQSRGLHTICHSCLEKNMPSLPLPQQNTQSLQHGKQTPWAQSVTSEVEMSQHHVYAELVVSSPSLPATNISSPRDHNFSDCTLESHLWVKNCSVSKSHAKMD